MNFKSTLGVLRIIGFLEGLSYILLFGVTMPMKYLYGNHGPNGIVGMAHGVLFIAYVILVFIVARQRKWKLAEEFWAYIASLLPFGTFFADAKIFRKYLPENAEDKI